MCGGGCFFVRRGWVWLGWDGMGWDGMGWDGMGWDILSGMTSKDCSILEKPTCSFCLFLCPCD